MRTYSELISIPTFEDRFSYLALHGKVGFETFGSDRYYNQAFYKSKEWADICAYVIERDRGCDLGIPDREIPEGSTIIVHHMNPITIKDIVTRSKFLLDPKFLITTIRSTHNKIHYGSHDILEMRFPCRSPNDMAPWLK